MTCGWGCTGCGTLTFAGDQPALPFDRLVYTPGSRSNARSVPGVLENGHTLDSAETSRQLAQALARQPASRVLIIGGGLTGIQTAAATSQRYPKATVTLLSSAPIGQELPEKACAYVHAALTPLGVDMIPDHHRVETVEPGRACWNGGQLEADLIAWTAGFTASGLGEQAGPKVTASGQVAVDANLRSLSPVRLRCRRRRSGTPGLIALRGLRRHRHRCHRRHERSLRPQRADCFTDGHERGRAPSGSPLY